jgi:hypothetical protein
MTKKLVGSPNDQTILVAILTVLIDVAKAQLSTGHHDDGTPVRQHDFKVLNDSRALRDRLRDG